MNNLNIKTEFEFTWDGNNVAQPYYKNELQSEENTEFIKGENVQKMVKEEPMDSFEYDKENTTNTLNLQDLNDAIDCLAAAAESDLKNAGFLNKEDLNVAIDRLADKAAAAQIEERTLKTEDSNRRNSQEHKSMLHSDLMAIKIEADSYEEYNSYCDTKNNIVYDNITDLNGFNICKDSELDTGNVHRTKPTTKQSIKKNLMLEWSTHAAFKKQQHTATSAVDVAAATPKAYVFKDIYQQKREEALRKREDEERKLREFHSRPMPNFNAFHSKMQRPICHIVTCPKTPLTLKTWRTNVEQRKQKQEEESQKLKVMEKPYARSVAYLHKEPFKPNLSKPTMVKQQPFQLGMEQRLQLRREYNATIQRTHEDQMKQLQINEENRKEHEIAMIKEIRKNTEFKARPNPFKQL